MTSVGGNNGVKWWTVIASGTSFRYQELACLFLLGTA